MPSCGLLTVLLLQTGTVNSVGSNNQISKSYNNKVNHLDPFSISFLDLASKEF